MARSSKAVQQVMDGSYYDKIVAFMRYGHERAPLNEEHHEIFQRIEWVKEQWLFHRSDRLVVKNTMQRYKCSQAQAYNYLSDAKAIFTLFTSTNIMAEMLLLKERIEKAFKLAEEQPKEYGKLYPWALAENRKWIEMMRSELERQRPDEPKKFVFHFHNDWSKIPGLTAEVLAGWEKEFDVLEQKARKRFNDAEDVEFAEF